MAKILVSLIGDASSLTRSFKQANASAAGFNRNMAKTGSTSKRGQGAMRSLGSSVRLAGGAFLGGAGLVAGITSTLSKTAEFEKSMNTFQAVTSASADQMKRAGAVATQLGGDITLPGTSAKDAALAMTELAKGGLTVQQAFAAAKGTLQLAAAGQVEVADAATISARALNAFGLGGDQAGRVADVLANAANVSTGEISDFALALQQSSAGAKSYGLTIEDTTAAIAELANKGIVGSDAGTSLKTMLTRLVPSTNKAGVAMSDLGVAYKDAHGNLIPFRQQIAQYSKALARLTPVQRAEAINTIFGSDAARAANIILGSGVEAYDKMHKAVGRQGAAAQIAAAKQKGLAGAMDALKSAVETVQIQIGTALAPALTKYLQAAARWVGTTKNQKAIMDALRTTVASVAVAFRVLRTVFAGLSKIVGGSRNAIITLVGAFVLFKAAKLATTILGIARSFGILRARTVASTVATNANAAANSRAALSAGVFRGSLIGKAGLVGAVGVTSFALTSMLLKATGLDKKLKSLGGSAFDLAGKLGLVKDPLAQFEGKANLGQKDARFLRQKSARLQASGLTAQQAAQRLVTQHPKVALRDAQVLSGVFGNKPQVQPPIHVHHQTIVDGQVMERTVTEAQRKAAKRNTTQRRGRIGGR